MIPEFVAANWLAWSLQVLILSATACIAARVLNISEPRSRLIGAQAVLVACLLFPFLAPRSNTPRGAVSVAVTGTVRPMGGRPIPGRSRRTWKLIVPGVLVVGTALRLLLMGTGLWKLRGYRTAARPLHPLPATFLEAFELTETNCEVMMSDRVASPAAFGFLHPMILLPVKFMDLPEDSQRAILCHELLHVRRRDWLAAIAEELAGAALWFQPAVHLLLNDIRLAREKLVDKQVVELTHAKEPYMQALLAVASEPMRGDISIAPLFLRRKNLKARITFLIEELSMSKTKLMFANLSLAALLFGAGWVSITNFPLVAAQEQSAVDDFDFSKTFPPAVGKRIRVGGNASQANLISKVNPTYPQMAKDAGIQGTVKLGVLIGADGNLHHIALISGHPLLAPAALQAVRQWVYRPTLLNGDPVEVITVVDVNFTLQN